MCAGGAIGTPFADSLTGTDAANTWAISASNAGSVGGIPFTNFENLTGGSEADTFVFAKGIGVSGNVDGAIIMSKTLNDPKKLERQIMLFRSLVKLMFAP